MSIIFTLRWIQLEHSPHKFCSHVSQNHFSSFCSSHSSQTAVHIFIIASIVGICNFFMNSFFVFFRSRSMRGINPVSQMPPAHVRCNINRYKSVSPTTEGNREKMKAMLSFLFLNVRFTKQLQLQRVVYVWNSQMASDELLPGMVQESLLLLRWQRGLLMINHHLVRLHHLSMMSKIGSWRHHVVTAIARR